MIEQHSGEYNIESYAKAASTLFARGDAVTKDSSGYLVKATATTPRSLVIGTIDRDVLATDSDYTENTRVAINVIKGNPNEFKIDVGTGTAVQAMVGRSYDLKDENELDVTVQLTKLFTITRIISTTEVLGRFNTDGEQMRLVTYVEDVVVADFSDGGAALGTLDLACSVPAGALFVSSMITNVVGFAGDTSATIEFGDGTDANRYSTGTPDVFATLAAGVDMGVPSGTKFHSAAKTPKLTITGATDFTAIISNGNGAARVALSWYEVA